MADDLRKRRERLAKASAQRSASGASQQPASFAGAPRSKRHRVSRKGKTQFTVQLATLQDAGLPILRSLRILGNQAQKGPLKELVNELSEEVEGGSSLSEAMSKHPGTFDDLYVNMVRAGEAGGALSTIFTRLADFMERADAIIRKVRGALVYPIFVTVFAVIILVILMTSVVPKFEAAFSAMGGELPKPTQWLIDLSRWVGDWLLLLILIPVGLYFVPRLIRMSTGGRRFLDGLALRMPLFGGLIKRSQVARFTRTLGTLSSSGVPLLDSLRIVGDASGNLVINEAVDQVRDAVSEGEALAGPMAETGLFDEIVVNMVDVGEETGELDRMLMRIADNYDQEVEGKIQSLLSLLEPTLIVVMGAIVGTIVVALFLPLMKMQEMVSGG